MEGVCPYTSYSFLFLCTSEWTPATISAAGVVPPRPHPTQRQLGHWGVPASNFHLSKVKFSESFQRSQ